MAPAAGHRIRLRGPWRMEYFFGSDRSTGASEIRKHPEDWPEVSRKAGGVVRMSRVFHAPTNVDMEETLFVVLSGVYGEGSVCLNGQPLGEFTTERCAWEFAVPFKLPFTNELSIRVTYPTPSAERTQVGVYDAIALEIRPSQA